MNKTKVLYLLSCPMNYGGTEAFIMNYYRKMDHDKIQIDFVYQGDGIGVYDDELLSYGSQIYRISNKSKHPLLFTKQIKELLLQQKYMIVHSQMDAMGAWPLLIAKNAGVPIRIAHSHNIQHQTNNFFKRKINDAAKVMLRKNATHYFACGIKAGKFLFGDKILSTGKVKIIHNGIDLNMYAYSEERRNRLRSELGLKNELVIGHVGQFRKQKNHQKIVEVFRTVSEKNVNAKLMLVGNGELKDNIKELVHNMRISDKVIFTGERSDICDVLNVFDVFLFPSLFEGLSIVAIEAQANGLPCVFSEMIPEETAITNLVIFKKLKDSNEIWSEAIIDASNMGRKDCRDKLAIAGYDINIEAKRLQEMYLGLAGGRL